MLTKQKCIVFANTKQHWSTLNIILNGTNSEQVSRKQTGETKVSYKVYPFCVKQRIFLTLKHYARYTNRSLNNICLIAVKHGKYVNPSRLRKLYLCSTKRLCSLSITLITVVIHLYFFTAKNPKLQNFITHKAIKHPLFRRSCTSICLTNCNHVQIWYKIM